MVIPLVTRRVAAVMNKLSILSFAATGFTRMKGLAWAPGGEAG